MEGVLRWCGERELPFGMLTIKEGHLGAFSPLPKGLHARVEELVGFHHSLWLLSVR